MMARLRFYWKVKVMLNSARSIIVICLSLLLSAAAAYPQASKNMRFVILPHFRLNYDKNVQEKDVQLVSKELQRSFDYFQSKFSFAPSDKINVYLYSSKERPRGTLLYSILDDSFFNDGKVVILATALHDEKHMLNLFIDRVVARAFLNTVLTCPAWMAETYGLAVGYDFARFGNPTRGHLTSFSDLGEDLSRADDTKEIRAVFAGMAATAKYFIDQYGETKLDAVVKSLHAGHTIEEAFENVFGGKFDDLERSWAEYMHSLLKG